MIAAALPTWHSKQRPQLANHPENARTSADVDEVLDTMRSSKIECIFFARPGDLKASSYLNG